MKAFFKERLELKKEFGEKITENDKQVFACKDKVNNFFDNIIDYSDYNNRNSRIINKKMKKSFKRISSHL